MALTRLDGNVFVNGNLQSTSMDIPAGTITNSDVNASADIDATKLEHEHRKHVNQVHGSAATTERRVIHTVKGTTGTVVAFRCGVVVACVGAATIDIDLLKNGTTILSAAIQLDNTNAAFAFEDASGFTSTTLAADDVLEADITATAGGGTLGQGLFCELTVREDSP